MWTHHSSTACLKWVVMQQFVPPLWRGSVALSLQKHLHLHSSVRHCRDSRWDTPHCLNSTDCTCCYSPRPVMSSYFITVSAWTALDRQTKTTCRTNSRSSMEIDSMVANSALIRAREGKRPLFPIFLQTVCPNTYFLSCWEFLQWQTLI